MECKKCGTLLQTIALKDLRKDLYLNSILRKQFLIILMYEHLYRNNKDKHMKLLTKFYNKTKAYVLLNPQNNMILGESGNFDTAFTTDEETGYVKSWLSEPRTFTPEEMKAHDLGAYENTIGCLPEWIGFNVNHLQTVRDVCYDYLKGG